jgi:hypothetical protein
MARSRQVSSGARKAVQISGGMIDALRSINFGRASVGTAHFLCFLYMGKLLVDVLVPKGRNQERLTRVTVHSVIGYCKIMGSPGDIR